jgi:exodeoxyribonuclease VIII
LGTGLHCLMLDGSKKFNETYFTGGPVNPKTGKGYGRDTQAFAEWANIQCLTHPGARFISEEQSIKILAMGEELMCHQSARPILSLDEDGANEVSVVADVDGIAVKARIDMLRPKFGLIADLKTTEDASWRGFSRSIVKYGYHRQAAWYLDICRIAGIEVDSFAFICVEKEPPFAVGCYRLIERDRAIGRQQCASMLEMIRVCRQTGEWPAYSDQFEDIGMHDWQAEKLERSCVK